MLHKRLQHLDVARRQGMLGIAVQSRTASVEHVRAQVGRRRAPNTGLLHLGKDDRLPGVAVAELNAPRQRPLVAHAPLAKERPDLLVRNGPKPYICTDDNLGLVLEPHRVQEPAKLAALPGVEVVQFHDRLAAGQSKIVAEQKIHDRLGLSRIVHARGKDVVQKDLHAATGLQLDQSLHGVRHLGRLATHFHVGLQVVRRVGPHIVLAKHQVARRRLAYAVGPPNDGHLVLLPQEEL